MPTTGSHRGHQHCAHRIFCTIELTCSSYEKSHSFIFDLRCCKILQRAVQLATWSIAGYPDGHYLQFADGTPFFWLGDTGWEHFHRLTRAAAAKYLDKRRNKGFTVIQAVVLAEFEGLRKPN